MTKKVITKDSLMHVTLRSPRCTVLPEGVGTMSLFTVTWTKTIEWIVEGDSFETVHEAAKLVSSFDIERDADFELDVIAIPPKYRGKTGIDAVLYKGELHHPDDVEDARKKNRREELRKSNPTIRCHQCEQDFPYAVLVFMGEVIQCPSCYFSMLDDDIESQLSPPKDHLTIDMFEDES